MDDQMAALQRALGTIRAISRDRSTSVPQFSGGEAVLNSDFPLAHNLNRLVVAEASEASGSSAADLVETAEKILGSAGTNHRLIEVHDAVLADRLTTGFVEYGYERSDDLVMAATRWNERKLPSADVVELDVAERIAVAHNDWRREQPGMDSATVDQLGRRIVTMLPAAETTFFAVRGPDGSVAARADLYTRDGVAQIDEVITDAQHRCQGFASLLVAHAVEKAHTRGAELVFLLTERDDWPQHLYRRLGFTDIGTMTSFQATP